jgi:hypothetical protein
MNMLSSYIRRLATAVLLTSLIISVTPFDLVEKTSAVWCGTFTPVYVDTAAGVDRAGCWGYDSAHPYKTIQAGTDARWALYTGIDTSSTIYFKDKRGGATEVVDNTGRFPFTIVPWTNMDTLSTTLDLRGQHLTVGVSGKAFKFTGGGVRLYTGVLDSMYIQNNSFTGGSAVRVRGARYYGTTYNNYIVISKNSFNNAEISVEGNEGMFFAQQNIFSGTVPADNDWFESWDSSNINILGNSSVGGRAGTFDGNTGLIVMSNSHSGNGADYGYYSYNSTGAEFDNNTISNVYKGITAINGSFNYIENNRINLFSTYSAMSLTRGIELINTDVNEIHHNTVSYSTDGIVQTDATVTNIYNNSFSNHSNDGLRLETVTAGKIYINTADTVGKAIYGTEDTTVTEISGNNISNSFSGIILETNMPDYDTANSGETIAPYDPGMATNHTKIYSNMFTNISDVGIGLAGINVDEVRTNFGTNMAGFIHSYNSVMGTLEGNMAEGNTMDDGIKLYSSSVSNFERNLLNGFQTGLEVTATSTILGGVNSTLFMGGVYGIRFEDSNLDSITNSIFSNNGYGIYGGTSTAGYSLRNSSFYNQSNNSIQQTADISAGQINIENTAFSKIAGSIIDLDTVSDIGILDFNIYDNSLGVNLLKDSASNYDFAALQSAGYEANGLYQDSGDLFPDAGMNIFGLNPASLGLNSANDALGITEDYRGYPRPVCGVSDMGAYESQDAADADADGLCDSQETAFGTDSANADSDADGLDDRDELYSYGTDALDSDTDDDLLEDGEEVTTYSSSPTDTDSDDDLLGDYDEAMTYGTDLDNVDTDGDTYSDYEEVMGGSDPLDASSTPDTLDDDSDGLSNAEETVYGTDPSDSDSDDDGLLDGEEVDTYGTNPLSSDSDSDGIEDNVELTSYGTDPMLADTDGDGFEDYVEILGASDPLDASSTPDTLDDDGDGLSNTAEATIGTDPNDTDTDNDGLSDYEEVFTYGTEPLLTDSDSDSIGDYEEIFTYGTDPDNADSDVDALSDYEEIFTYGTDAMVADSDSDGLYDGVEILTYGTDPLDDDSDNDLLSDGDEVSIGSDPLDTDTDNDTISDGDEVALGTDPLSTDSDSDGLSDGDEVSSYLTDPTLSDTDGDTYDDGAEIAAGSDPLDASNTPGTLDTDGDGLTYDEEAALGTDPLVVDTDGDGLNDYEEAMIYGTNALDADSDSDTLNDYDEVITYGTDPWSSDTDGDSYDDMAEILSSTDPLDATSNPGALDSDGDGLTYDDELIIGTDPLDTDTDDDGLSDFEEAVTYGTDPLSGDSDSDGLSDYAEVVTYGTDANDADTDADTYDDATEITAGSNPLDATSTPGTLDSDSDGLSYDEEVAAGTDSADSDTDDDGLLDGEEVDTYGTDPLDSDSDADGLSDGDEVDTYGTDPLDSDTDGDTYDDATEIAAGSDPLDASSDPTTSVDTDGDGLTDYQETSVYGTDPADSDSDDDTLSDYDEIITYGLDANSNDTDADGFRDDYEIAQATDANDSSSTPNITIYAVGYNALTGYSGSYRAYTSYDSDSISIGETLEHEVETNGNGALGLSWNTDAFLGTLTVTYCGAQTGAWTGSEFADEYASATCSASEDYSTAYSAGTYNSLLTSVTDSSQLEVWSSLSSYYTFSAWDWYRIPYTTSSYQYHLMRIQLNP